MSFSNTIVVGAGTVGVSTAYYLAEKGQKVTLIEKNLPGSGCSQANAGQITPGHLPLPQPGTMRRNLRWLFTRTSPLYIQPRLDFHLLVWLLRFARACNPRQLQLATEMLCRLGRFSSDRFAELASRFSFGYQFPGRLEICRDSAGFLAVQKEAELLDRFGYSAQILPGDEVNRFEPAVTAEVAGGVFFPESGQCNPHRFCMEMAEQARRLGARVMTETEVTGIQVEAGRFTGVTIGRETLAGDSLVLATGAWGPLLARILGLRIPVQPAKGYSLDFDRPEPCPRCPVVAVQEKVFITPIDDFLRLGGTMELSGYNLNPIPDRLAMLARGASKYLGPLRLEQARSRWWHWRPMTPDGLPVIGPAPRVPNAWIATGHGMLGVTQGPGTGYLLAESIIEGKASIDTVVCRPDRRY